jgi:hypothetical protein
MLEKRGIINFLYVISFPLYGIGWYILASFNSIIGHMFSVSTYVLIIVFYLIDILYKKELKIKANYLFFIMLLFQISCIAAFFVAFNKNPPFSNARLTYTRAGITMLPFLAFVVVGLYNEGRYDKLTKLTFNSLSWLLIINVVGFYVLGLKNETHSIEGRLSLPFMDGFYSGACLIAIINIMLIYYLKESADNPIRFSYLLAYFFINLFFLYSINSRLANLVFLLVFILSVFNVTQKFKGLFVVGVFLIPLLLNLGLLLYEILSLPFFKLVMKRVDIRDVTTYNGRSLVWERAIDWLLYDQTDITFGNGDNGHYFLHLMPDIAKVWQVPETSTHLHSTSLSILVDQGIVGYLLLLFITYKAYMYYKEKSVLKSKEGVFFPVIVFLLFVMQIDMFVYRESLGATILSFFIAMAALTKNNPTLVSRKKLKLEKRNQ